MNLMAGSPAETSYEQAQFWHHCLRLMIRYSKSSCESWATELKSLPKTKKGDNPEKVSPFVQKTGVQLLFLYNTH